MQESFDKYYASERIRTNPLIDDPAIIFLGRTLGELLVGSGVFVGAALFGDEPLLGLIGCFVAVWLAPLYRTKCPRGLIIHLSWALGLNAPAYIPCPRLFSPKRSVARFGP